MRCDRGRSVGRRAPRPGRPRCAPAREGARLPRAGHDARRSPREARARAGRSRRTSLRSSASARSSGWTGCRSNDGWSACASMAHRSEATRRGRRRPIVGRSPRARCRRWPAPRRTGLGPVVDGDVPRGHCLRATPATVAPIPVLRPRGGAPSCLSCCPPRPASSPASPAPRGRSTPPWRRRAAPRRPRRVVVVGARVVADVRRELEDRIAAIDGDALVLDISDGWASLALLGDDADDGCRTYRAWSADPGWVRPGRRGARRCEDPGRRPRRPPPPRARDWSEYVRARASEGRPRDRGARVTGLLRRRTFLARTTSRRATTS